MSHEALLRWFLDAVVPDSISPPRAAEMLSCLREVDRALGDAPAESRICGIEWHHDGSGRADLGVLLDLAAAPLQSAIGLPAWWADFQHGRSRATSRHQRMLPPHHFLEFDVDGAGGLTLAGVFQTVEPPFDPHPDDIEALLTHLGSTAVGHTALTRSTRLACCLAWLGMPEQVGVMCGRGDLLKLVVNPARAATGGVSALLDALQDDTAQPWPLLHDPDWRAFIEASDAAHAARLSVDLDLAADRFLPRLGVELADIGPPNGVVFPQLARTLTGTGHVPDAAVAAMTTLWARLPVGVERRPRVPLALLRPHRRTAHVSHVKVTVSPSAPPSLKSYVEVTGTALVG